MIDLKMAQARSGVQASEEITEGENGTQASPEMTEDAAKRAANEESARKYKESLRKISLMRELRGGDGPNRYEMPPGEAEIWGDDEENEEEQE